jgi:hypothetical protein
MINWTGYVEEGLETGNAKDFVFHYANWIQGSIEGELQKLLKIYKPLTFSILRDTHDGYGSWMKQCIEGIIAHIQ